MVTIVILASPRKNLTQKRRIMIISNGIRLLCHSQRVWLHHILDLGTTRDRLSPVHHQWHIAQLQ